jgi:hypothetical protein
MDGRGGLLEERVARPDTRLELPGRAFSEEVVGISACVAPCFAAIPGPPVWGTPAAEGSSGGVSTSGGG